MEDLDMTNTTMEIPKYLKNDIRALASIEARKQRKQTITMKDYLITLINREKKSNKL